MAETHVALKHRLSLATELAAQVASLESLEELVAALVGQINALIPCDCSGWSDVNLLTGEVRVTLDDRPQPWEKPTLLNHRLLPLPLVTRYENERTLRSARISDMVGSGWHRTPSYNECYRPMDVKYQAGVGMFGGAQFLYGLTLNRSLRDFSDYDLFFLDLLRPTATSTMKRLMLVEKKDAILRHYGADHALASLDSGTLTPVDVEPLADDLLREAGMSPLLSAGRSRLRELLADLGEGDQFIEKGIVVLKVSDAEAARTVLAVHPSHQRTDPLTPRQQQILAKVRSGATAKAVARELCVSERTVEKHLQNAYSRLGVQNRIEAFQVLDGIDDQGQLGDSGRPGV